MSIVTSLLHADEKENVMTRFYTNKQNQYQRPVYIYSCCHSNGTCVSFQYYQKSKVVLLTRSLSFLETKGSRVLQEKVTEIRVEIFVSSI